MFSWIKKNYFFLTPFTLSLYEVLFLYSQNIKEYKLQVLTLPSAIALILTGIVFLIVQAILRNIKQSAIITSAFIFIFFSYGNFLEEGKNLRVGVLGAESIILTLSLLVFSAVVFGTFKFENKLLNMNKLLFALSVILIIFPLYDIIKFENREKRFLKANTKQEKLTLDPIDYKGERPDIYYIILDRYDGQRALAEQLGFDNSKFLNFLKDKGFYIPSNSTTNYPKTFLSLASSLNMEYMDFLTEETNGGMSGNQSIVTPYIQNSKVLEYLKNHGYLFYNVGSWWEPTHANPNADKNFFPPKRGYFGTDEFATGFINTSIAAPILKYALHDPMDVSEKQENNVHRQSALYQFKVLENIATQSSPGFVFAHILLPHDPFVLDRGCNPISETVTDANTHQVNYINQLVCTNTKVEKMVNDIISKSKNQPVIIIQADEGTFPMNVPISENEGWGSAETTSLREKFPILNAYYFPDHDYSGLYDTITPVNSFRVVFNKYFGEKFPLLEDKNVVFEDDNNYYRFIDVTLKVAN